MSPEAAWHWRELKKKNIPTVCYTVYAYMYAIGQNLAFGSCLPHMVKNKIKITALLTRFQSFLGPTRHRCWETSTAAVLQPCLCRAIAPDPGWQTDLPWPKTHPIIAELALWSLGCVWLWLLSLDLIPTLSCSLPRLISDLPYHDKLACVYGSLTTPGCHPQDLCPCLIHTVGLYPLYPVRLLLPAWNNLSGETTCLFCSLTVFITIITYIHIYYFFFRECHISQLRCMFQSKYPLSPEDKWMTCSLPAPYLSFVPSHHIFLSHQLNCFFGLLTQFTNAQQRNPQVCSRKGEVITYPYGCARKGRRMDSCLLVTLAPPQQQLLQFPYFIAHYSSFIACG